jgi:hypothetical protein
MDDRKRSEGPRTDNNRCVENEPSPFQLLCVFSQRTLLEGKVPYRPDFHPIKADKMYKIERYLYREDDEEYLVDYFKRFFDLRILSNEVKRTQSHVYFQLFILNLY